MGLVHNMVEFQLRQSQNCINLAAEKSVRNQNDIHFLKWKKMDFRKTAVKSEEVSDASSVSVKFIVCKMLEMHI